MYVEYFMSRLREETQKKGLGKKKKGKKTPAVLLEDDLHGRFDISEQEEHRCEQLIIIKLTVMGYRDD